MQAASGVAQPAGGSAATAPWRPGVVQMGQVRRTVFSIVAPKQVHTKISFIANVWATRLPQWKNIELNIHCFTNICLATLPNSVRHQTLYSSTVTLETYDLNRSKKR